jgi:hypothetical protein
MAARRRAGDAANQKLLPQEFFFERIAMGCDGRIADIRVL